MRVTARTGIVEAGALRLPGDVFEVSEERFESLGDVVEIAPEEPEIDIEPDDTVDGSNPGERGVSEPEGGDEKQTQSQKIKGIFSFKGGTVDVSNTDLSKITREEVQYLNMDELNDLFSGFEGLKLNPKKQSKDEMLNAIFAHIEQIGQS